jgi:roadblock/LC7 domain-containing protein
MKRPALVLTVVFLLVSASAALAGPDLDKLMKLPGAVAAGEFSDDGKMVRYRGHLSMEIADMVAKMCLANVMMGRMQAEGFSKFSGMDWMPYKGFALSAGDYSVWVIGNVGVFVESAKTDFNQVFKQVVRESQKR